MSILREVVNGNPSIRKLARKVKRAGRLITGNDVLYKYDIKVKKFSFVSVYGGWTIDPSHLNRTSIIFSFGVGDDISFDLSLIDKFGLTVHGFDPSPESIDWLDSMRELPTHYHFHPYGLALSDGEIEFVAENDSSGMYSIAKTLGVGNKVLVLPVKSLSTILDELNIKKIDVLKMDIEGVEYQLIDALVSLAPRIGQLLIEFHHRIGIAPLKTTVDSVNRLRAAGFKLFHVTDTSSEFSFIRA